MDRLSEKLPMPAGYFDLALRQLGTTAQAAAALLEGTGVSLARLAEPDAEITLGQQLRQLRNANQTFPPGWALAVGRAFQPSTHGPVGIAAISAPTLAAALDVIERDGPLLHQQDHAGEGLLDRNASVRASQPYDVDFVRHRPELGVTGVHRCLLLLR